MVRQHKPPTPPGDGDSTVESKQLPHQRPEDDTLIALYNKGNEQAYLVQVYLDCKDGVINFLKGHVAPEYREDIVDIFHDGFINFSKMVKGRRDEQLPLPQPLNHLDYLRATAWHEYLKRLEKAKRLPTVSLSSTEDGDEQRQMNSVENEASLLLYEQDEFDKMLDTEEFRVNISKLREPYRTTLLLKCEDLSYEEIAERMRCSVGMVKTWVYRGKKLLGQLYQDGQEG